MRVQIRMELISSKLLRVLPAGAFNHTSSALAKLVPNAIFPRTSYTQLTGTRRKPTPGKILLVRDKRRCSSHPRSSKMTTVVPRSPPTTTTIFSRELLSSRGRRTRGKVYRSQCPGRSSPSRESSMMSRIKIRRRTKNWSKMKS